MPLRRQTWAPHSSLLEFVLFDIHADANSWFLNLGVSHGVFCGEESDRGEKVGGAVEVLEVVRPLFVLLRRPSYSLCRKFEIISAVLDEKVADSVTFEAYTLPVPL